MNLFEFAETPDFMAMSDDGRALLIAHIASAVADAHTKGVLHNDLKPSNVLIFPRGGSISTANSAQTSMDRWQIKVVDFGIASLNELGQLENLKITDYGEFIEESRKVLLVRHEEPLCIAHQS